MINYITISRYLPKAAPPTLEALTKSNKGNVFSTIRQKILCQCTLFDPLCTVNLDALFSIMSYMAADGIFAITFLVNGQNRTEQNRNLI